MFTYIRLLDGEYGESTSVTAFRGQHCLATALQLPTAAIAGGEEEGRIERVKPPLAPYLRYLIKCSILFLDSGRLQIVFIAEHQRKQRLLGTSAPAVFRCVFRAKGAGLYRTG